MVCAGAGVSFYCKHVRDVFGFTLCQSFINPHGPLTAFPSRDQNSNMHSALKHIITPSLISMQSTWNACLQIVCTTNCFFDFSVDGVHCFKLTNFGRSAVGILTLCKLVFLLSSQGGSLESMVWLHLVLVVNIPSNLLLILLQTMMMSSR